MFNTYLNLDENVKKLLHYMTELHEFSALGDEEAVQDLIYRGTLLLSVVIYYFDKHLLYFISFLIEQCDNTLRSLMV